MSIRSLTKSRFKVGHQCPTKLFYLDDARYGNKKDDDAFLRALADGGFQVGELAKLYFPGGVEVETLAKDEALRETAALLERENVVIFEGAVQFGNLFLRADVIVKKGNRLELKEVKSKSFDPEAENPFLNKTALKSGRRVLHGEWEEYLLDAAFQTFVIQKAYPKFEVSTSLMLANKNAAATVDGLNQKFLLTTGTNGRTKVKTLAGTTLKSVGDTVLVDVNIDREVAIAYSTSYDGRSFEEHVHFLEKTCVDRDYVQPKVTSSCKGCEFRINRAGKEDGLKSGFDECMLKTKLLKQADLDKPLVFDLWFYKSEESIEDGVVLMEDLTLEPEDGDGPALTRTQRQALQLEYVKTQKSEPYINVEALHDLMTGEFQFPLHFIDFETARVAIPFHIGRRVYEQVAFQFSHHVLHKDGRIEHRGQHLDVARGNFPNFDFVRALKKSLEKDEGTIFRYHNHENSVLRDIREQIEETKPRLKDADELIEFIDHLPRWPTGKMVKGKTEYEFGPRAMVDLYQLVVDFYYDPLMRGSNSIKAVLPAVLRSSKYLQARYAEPIYGTAAMPSLNFKDKAWVKLDDAGTVLDPYKSLGPIFSGDEVPKAERLFFEDELADGGAAMTAYARTQFTEMSDAERTALSAALLRYCELDTFAMVLLFEYWQHEVKKVVGKKTRKPGKAG